MEPMTLNIPVLALRGLTVFPHMALSFDVERKISINALERAMEGDRRLFDISIGQLNNEEKIFVSQKKVIRINENPTSKKAVITSQSKGFAFARPDDGSPDVFIHNSKLGEAMIRDTVLLRDIVTDDRGVSGRVDKILERGERNTGGRRASFNPNFTEDNRPKRGVEGGERGERKQFGAKPASRKPFGAARPERSER